MSWILSNDGVSVDGERNQLPSNLQRHPDTGEWVQVTPDNAAVFNAYPLQKTPRPDADHMRSVENQGPGQFSEVWTYSEELARENAERDARRQTAEQARNRTAWFDDRAQQWADAPPADDQQSIMDQINAMQRDWQYAHTQLAELTFAIFGVADPDQTPPEPIEQDRKR